MQKDKPANTIVRFFCRTVTLSVVCLWLVACGSSSNDESGQLDDSPAPSTINRDNYIDLLSHVFSIYVGDIYNQPLIDISRFTISGQHADGTFFDVHDCEAGDFEQSINPTSTNAGVFFSYIFHSCVEDGITFDGEIEGQNGGRGLVFDTASYTIRTHPQLFSTFSGYAQQFRSQTGFFDQIHSWDTSGFNLDARTIDGDLTIDTMTSSFAHGNSDWGSGIDKAWLRGGFTVRSDHTGGASISVSTPVEFAYELQARIVQSDGGDTVTPEYVPMETRIGWNFTTGQLQLIGEDGSSLLLDADTDDAASVSITINNDSGVESFNAPWSLWQRTLRFDAYPMESPDWISAERLASAQPDAGPAITAENHAALLDSIFALITGQKALAPLVQAQRFMTEMEPVETTRLQGVRTDHYNCEAGGRARVLRQDDDTSIFPRDYRVEFNNCDAGGYQLDGTIRGQEISSADGAQGLDTRNLQWLDGGGDSFRFNGQSSVSQSSDDVTRCSWQTRQMNFQLLPEGSDAGAVAGVVTGETRFETQGAIDMGVALTLHGEFTVASVETGGFEIDVKINNVMTARNVVAGGGNAEFSEGELTLVAYDGSSRWSDDRSRLVFRAGSGIEITNREGVFDIQAPWTSWQADFTAVYASLCGS